MCLCKTKEDRRVQYYCGGKRNSTLFRHGVNDVYFSSALLSIPAQQFKLVLDSIVWAFKHTMRNVADIGMA